MPAKRSRCLGVAWRCCMGVETRRRRQLGRSRPALHRLLRGLAHRFRQAFHDDAGAMPWLLTLVALGMTQQAAKYPAHETADTLPTGLARFRLAQAFLATQVERGMGTFLVSVGVEVLDDLRSDGWIGNAAVETDPHSLFFERDRGAVRACNTHTWQMKNGVLQ